MWMQRGYVLQVTPSASAWERTATARIGDAIRGLRHEQGLSAQKLSERLAELGLNISRASISALENGSRPYVTVTEVMLFARALNTSPITLIFPGLDYSETIEALPAVQRTQRDAAAWFCTATVLMTDPGFTDDPKLYRSNTRLLGLSRHEAELRAQVSMADSELAIVNSDDVNQIKALTLLRERGAKALAEVEIRLQTELERRGG